MRTNVDLPDPDSPTMPRLPPSCNVTSTPSNARRTAHGPKSDVPRQRVLSMDLFGAEQRRRGGDGLTGHDASSTVWRAAINSWRL